MHLVALGLVGPSSHGDISSWASYQIRKIMGCACAGNAGNVLVYKYRR